MSAANQQAHAAGFDVERIRRDFPILDQQSHGHPLVFLDSAASAQKPGGRGTGGVPGPGWGQGSWRLWRRRLPCATGRPRFSWA